MNTVALIFIGCVIGFYIGRTAYEFKLGDKMERAYRDELISRIQAIQIRHKAYQDHLPEVSEGEPIYDGDMSNEQAVGILRDIYNEWMETTEFTPFEQTAVMMGIDALRGVRKETKGNK
jgi:hypothetical protein